MITKVQIVDNTNTPLSYISTLDNFNNGMEYNFKPGINIIIGENSCGKTTLIRLMSHYLLCNGKNMSEISEDNINQLEFFKKILSEIP